MPAADGLARVRDGLERMSARPIAHRGLHACGAPGPLENTIEAAAAAIEAGYGIECDVRLSRDGVPMVFHDATLERLGGRGERLADLDAADLAALRLVGGARIATLEALLAEIGGRAALVIELKGADDDGVRLADAVCTAIAPYDGPLALESFDAEVVAACRHAPCPVGLVGPGDPPVPVGDLPRCDFLSWSVEHLPALPARLPLTSWTVRTPAQVAMAASAGAQIVFEGFRPSAHRP